MISSSILFTPFAHQKKKKMQKQKKQFQEKKTNPNIYDLLISQTRTEHVFVGIFNRLFQLSSLCEVDILVQKERESKKEGKFLSLDEPSKCHLRNALYFLYKHYGKNLYSEDEKKRCKKGLFSAHSSDCVAPKAENSLQLERFVRG